MGVRHEWVRVPIVDLRPGESFVVGSRGRAFRVGRLERWTRWDGVEMVTVIDTDGRGLAAREASFVVRALRWSDDGRGLAAFGGVESLLRGEGLL